MSTMTMSTGAAGASSGGCGCGGSCGGGTCGCSTTPARSGSFSRPRFFAGQLLTQEDLEALVDYVVGKNRLHNRNLFGDGVVCGLQLSCDPCNPSAVKVGAGYALDCCGNDLLVPCAEGLDVRALLRDLRARQAAGYQCGDPCEDKSGKRRYGLYLTYRETMADPVAPYASGDPCGQQQCQPTRIEEGYGFELRCDCADTARVDVFKRILACVGDLRAAASAVAKAQTNQVLASSMQAGLYRMKAGEPAAFTAADADAVRSAKANFGKLDALAANSQKAKEAPDESEYRAQLDEFRAATGAMARFRVLTPTARRKAEEANPGLAKALAEAETAMPSGIAAVNTLAPKAIFDPTMVGLARSSARLAESYALTAAPEEAYSRPEARLLIHGAAIGSEQVSVMKADAAVLKTWLLERLEGSCSITSCTLYDEVLAIRIGDPDAKDADEADMTATSAAVRKLTVAMVRYFIDCICAALNPPCPDCSDTAVLLGCVEIDKCNVTDLCNLSRRFVLTPVALRYWLPPLGLLGDLFERLCCEFDPADLFARSEKPVEPEIAGQMPPRPNINVMAASYAPVVRSGAVEDSQVRVLNRLNLTAKDAENISAFGSNLARLAMRSADVAIAEAKPTLEAAFSGLTKRFAQPVPVTAPAAAVPVAAAPATAAATSAAAKAAVAKELAGGRLAAAVAAAPAMTELKLQNDKLMAELDALKTSVASLRKDQ